MKKVIFRSSVFFVLIVVIGVYLYFAFDESAPESTITEVVVDQRTDEQKADDEGSTTSTQPLFIAAWGSNAFGQLGSLSNPQIALSSPLIEVAAGGMHTLALSKKGSVYSWGDNSVGQLGRTTASTTESQLSYVSSLSKVQHIYTQGNSSFALTKDATVYSWGDNFAGQLGTGDTSGSLSPKLIKNLLRITEVAPGYTFTLALDTDGVVWKWGGSCNPQNTAIATKLLQKFDTRAQLKGGYYDLTSSPKTSPNQGEECLDEEALGASSLSPESITVLPKITSLSAGYRHGLMLSEAGDVYAFGSNDFGQTGKSTTTRLSAPDEVLLALSEKIEDLPKIVAISAGYRHSLALAEDGAVYAWGVFSTKTKAGKYIPSSKPQKVILAKGLVPASVFAGRDYSMVLDKKGLAWGWGDNSTSLINPKAAKFLFSPILIPRISEIFQVGTGDSHIVVLTSTSTPAAPVPTVAIPKR